MNAFESKGYRLLKFQFLLAVPLHLFVAWAGYFKWIVVNTDPAETWRGYFVICAIFALLIIMVFLAYFSGIWYRCSMKIDVDDSGIRTGGLGIGKREYHWVF